MFDLLKFLVTGIVLVHALVTGPLLVNCISADGRTLVELLGHDPCHVEAGPPFDASRAGIDAQGAVVDPCADVLMGNPAVMQPILEAPAPGSGARGLPNASAVQEIFSGSVHPARRPDRDALPGVKSGPRLEFSLRV